jgi:hypothetical protein
MDPEIFNSLAGVPDLSSYAAPDVADVPAGNLTLSAVDSSGNITMPTMMGIGSLMGAGGDFLSAYGAVTQGEEEQTAYNYNANLALEQGQFDVTDLSEQETDTLSTQKAIYAKSGVEFSGSPLDTAVNTATNFEMDKQIATYNAQSQANMDTYEGQVAKQQADFSAGTDVLGGVEDLAFAALLL